MKNILILCVLMIIMLTGCGYGYENKTDKLEKQVCPVVERYLENSAAGNWMDALDTLTGEALAEAKANAVRVKSREKVVSKEFEAHMVCQDIAEVSADFIISDGAGYNRLAYIFRLRKENGRWYIFKVSRGEYLHGDLKSGRLPPEAANAIKSYIELPFSQKRSSDSKYLTGILLEESRKARTLPLDVEAGKDQERIILKAGSLECLGVTDGYAVVRVGYEVFRDGMAFPVESLVDVLDVNGIWKICRIDIIK